MPQSKNLSAEARSILRKFTQMKLLSSRHRILETVLHDDITVLVLKARKES